MPNRRNSSESQKVWRYSTLSLLYLCWVPGSGILRGPNTRNGPPSHYTLPRVWDTFRRSHSNVRPPKHSTAILFGDATNVIALLTWMKILRQENRRKSSNAILFKVLMADILAVPSQNHQYWRCFQVLLVFFKESILEHCSVPIYNHSDRGVVYTVAKKILN